MPFTRDERIVSFMLGRNDFFSNQTYSLEQLEQKHNEGRHEGVSGNQTPQYQSIVQKVISGILSTYSDSRANHFATTHFVQEISLLHDSLIQLHEMNTRKAVETLKAETVNSSNLLSQELCSQRVPFDNISNTSADRIVTRSQTRRLLSKNDKYAAVNPSIDSKNISVCEMRNVFKCANKRNDQDHLSTRRIGRVKNKGCEKESINTTVLPAKTSISNGRRKKARAKSLNSDVCETRTAKLNISKRKINWSCNDVTQSNAGKTEFNSRKRANVSRTHGRHMKNKESSNSWKENDELSVVPKVTASRGTLTYLKQRQKRQQFLLAKQQNDDEYDFFTDKENPRLGGLLRNYHVENCGLNSSSGSIHLSILSPLVEKKKCQNKAQKNKQCKGCDIDNMMNSPLTPRSIFYKNLADKCNSKESSFSTPKAKLNESDDIRANVGIAVTPTAFDNSFVNRILYNNNYKKKHKQIVQVKSSVRKRPPRSTKTSKTIEFPINLIEEEDNFVDDLSDKDEYFNEQNT